MAKVSVIVPNYNHEKYLKKRIDSILNQTYKDFELIILDDSSTDNSRIIIEEYRSSGINIIVEYNSKNSGSPFIQWKKGIEKAEGEFIWIAESDDYTCAEFLETLVGSLENNLSSKLIFCDSILFTEDKEISNICSKGKFIFHEGSGFIVNRMIEENAIFNASMCVFRKENQDLINIEKSVQFKLCGDWMFWLLSIQDKRIIEYTGKLNYYRKHSSSTSAITKRTQYVKEHRMVLKKIYNIVEVPQNRKVAVSRNLGNYLAGGKCTLIELWQLLTLDKRLVFYSLFFSIKNKVYSFLFEKPL